MDELIHIDKILINNEDEIKLSVTLPIYRSKHIIWITFESLMKQKNINFNWELIIIQERLEPYISYDEIETKYLDNLIKIGLKRIVYIEIKNWIPLSKKWINLFSYCSDTSVCTVLVHSDAYNQSYRLIETYDIFNKQEDIVWVCSKKGIFYDIYTGKKIIFDGNLQNKGVNNPGKAGLYRSIRTNIAKKINTDEYPERYVDSWLYKNSCKIVKDPIVIFNESDNWKYSLETDGLNKIFTGS